MKDIKEKDIKTLKKTKDGYSYRIKVLDGNDIIVSGIPTVEEVIEHCEAQLRKLNLQMLK